MEDTDWRPSACPDCGQLREAARHPKCTNSVCQLYRGNKSMKTNSVRYLWIRPNSAETPMLIIDDPVKLLRGSQFDESVDKLYQLGPEVKLKITVEALPTYRRSDY